MLTKSIRWRMQLWLAFLLACILSGFGVTAYQLHRTNRISLIDEELERRVGALGRDTRNPSRFGLRGDRSPFEPGWATNSSRFDFGPPPKRQPFEPSREGPPRRPVADGRPRRGWPERPFEAPPVRLSPETSNLFAEGETNAYFYAIWSITGNLLKRSTNAPADLLLPARFEGDTRIQRRTREARREAFQFTEIGECVLAGRPIAADLKAMRRFAWLLVAAGGTVLALGLGGGWLLASRALRPVEDISAAASRISVGNLAERINVADTDSELGRLAAVLNSTFARLEAAFAQQKQFTADASHELRTPIAVIIAEAQTALARERNAAEYRETVEACLDAAQQMKRLSQSLLELARYDAGQETLEHSPVDLAERAGACVELVQPLARERGIQVHCDLSPAELRGDIDRLGQVIINLLSNAIHYNKEHGEVRLATRTESGAAILCITDTGHGISAEDLPHVFERFYRADKSRGRTSGHSGLGLAICKAIVEAHGGTIEVSSEPGLGTTFTLRLPR